jgi:hypothetical protein
MNVHSATCSCSIELYKLWYTLADFCRTGTFRGVFSKYHYFAVRISEAAMGGARDIIFHNLGAQWKDTPSHCDFLRGFFFLLFAGRISEAAMGRTGVGGLNMINMTIRELYYTFGDFFQNWNFSIYNLYNINIAESSCRFTVPPTVALLNFKNSGIYFGGFFAKLEFSRGFLYILFTGMSCDGRETLYFIECRVAHIG